MQIDVTRDAREQPAQHHEVHLRRGIGHALGEREEDVDELVHGRVRCGASRNLDIGYDRVNEGLALVHLVL